MENLDKSCGTPAEYDNQLDFTSSEDIMDVFDAIEMDSICYESHLNGISYIVESCKKGKILHSLYENADSD